MSKKIAPTLSRFVEERSCGQDVCRGKSSCHVAAEELRALLAVARAALKMLPQTHSPAKLLAWSFRDEDVKALDRALARLARSSGTGKRKEGTR